MDNRWEIIIVEEDPVDDAEQKDDVAMCGFQH